MENSKADILLIRKYLNGELDERAMYALERRAQDDPELMDMMMGMEMGNKESHDASLLIIDHFIKQRTHNTKTKKIIPWRAWSVAASLFLILSVGTFLLLRQPQQPMQGSSGQQVRRNKEPESRVTVPGEKKAVPIPENTPVLNSDAVALAKKKSPASMDLAVLKPKVTPGKPVQVTISAAIVNPALAEGVAAGNSVAVLKKDQDSLIDAPGSLKEVAIVGYAKPLRKEVASASVMVRGAATVPSAALQGKVAGVSVDQQQSKRSSSVLISGKITDAEGNEPLPGVDVRLDKSNIATTTDINGRFTIAVPEKGDLLKIGMIGYDQKLVKIKNQKDSLNIRLQPASSALSEVVVVGYGRQNKTRVPDFKAQPDDGWAAYRTYLKENATLNDGNGGKVTVAFKVDQNGSPADFKIIKSSGNPAIDQKAQQLILNGPKWNRNLSGSDKVITLKIKFH